MSTRNNTRQGTTAGDDGRDVQASIAVMVDHLRPHAVSLDALWEAMPGAFLVAFGREVDKADSYDLALCHAALGAFDI